MNHLLLKLFFFYAVLLQDVDVDANPETNGNTNQQGAYVEGDDIHIGSEFSVLPLTTVQ